MAAFGRKKPCPWLASGGGCGWWVVPLRQARIDSSFPEACESHPGGAGSELSLKKRVFELLNPVSYYEYCISRIGKAYQKVDLLSIYGRGRWGLGMKNIKRHREMPATAAGFLCIADSGNNHLHNLTEPGHQWL